MLPAIVGDLFLGLSIGQPGGCFCRKSVGCVLLSLGSGGNLRAVTCFVSRSGSLLTDVAACAPKEKYATKRLTQ
jgi:hypothetical protein